MLADHRVTRMMAAAMALALALWLLLPPAGVGGAGPPPIQDGEFTFLLPAGRKQCFYQSAPANASLEAEYQVIGGAGLDVDFTLESPQGVLLVSEARKADGVHTVEPTEAGDYKLCFDNSFSAISEKLVFFELIFDSLQDDEEVEGWAEAVEPEEMLDVKMEDIKVLPGRGTPPRWPAPAAGHCYSSSLAGSSTWAPSSPPI